MRSETLLVRPQCVREGATTPHFHEDLAWSEVHEFANRAVHLLLQAVHRGRKPLVASDERFAPAFAA